MKVDIFRPVSATSVAASTSSAAAALPGPGSAVRLANLDASAIIYVKFGFSAAGLTATPNDIAIQPGTVELFDISPEPNASVQSNNQPMRGYTHFAYIASTGTPSLNVVTGEGC